MSASHSQSKSSQETSSVNQSTNLNVQDTDGITLAQSSGNTISTTDHGAVKAGRDIASDSFGFATDAIRDVLSSNDNASERISSAASDALSFGRSLFSGALDAVTGSQQDALSYGRSALDAVTGSQQDALSHSESLFMGATDLIGSAYESAFNTASDVLKSSQASVAGTVSNLNAISRQASTSDAERNQSIVKYALIAASVMVVAFALRGAK